MTTIDTPTDHPPPSTTQPDSVDVADAGSDTGPTSQRSSFFARHGLTNLDVLMMFVLVLITCAYTPLFFTWFWAPRAIMLFVVLPAGMVATGILARRRDRAARWALALIAWATLSAALSGGFFASFRGFVGQDTTVLFWAAALGLYSLGRLMSDPGREMLSKVVLVVLAVHALIGSLQMLLQIEGGNIALVGGRAIGLTPNAVYFGGFMAMGVALCLHRVATGSARVGLWSGGAALFAVALSFSGSRVAFGSVVIVSAILLIRHWGRALPLAVVGVVGGILVGSVITRTLGSGRDTASRLSARSRVAGARSGFVRGMHSSTGRSSGGGSGVSERRSRVISPSNMSRRSTTTRSNGTHTIWSSGPRSRSACRVSCC